MEITYSERAERHTADLREATEQLRSLLADSSDVVHAHWDVRENEKGKPLYVLRFRGHAEEVAGSFEIDELRSSALTRIRLYRLWGELLRAENRRRIEAFSSAES